MGISTVIAAGGIAAAAAALLRRKGGARRRAAYIESYRFPAGIERRLAQKYPQLTSEQRALVLNGLREFFHVCNGAGRRFVSMPSQAVDDAWHELILFTRAYRAFCRRALGRFLHHTPAEAMRTPTVAQAGIKRAWRIACRHEGINPRAPERLPLLFAIDALLDIPKGFRYSLNCRGPGASGYCASHIGCSTGCEAGCGADASGGSGGDAGGDSGGCGGGGCGGD